MAKLPTDKSATTSGAAKDDALGQDGDFTFAIADLLANDPGGAAKLGTGGQFFFSFKTTIEAVVRVLAADEDSARKLVPTVLGAPGTADIRIANENVGIGLGIQAVIDEVKFNAAPGLTLLEVNGERVKRPRR
jgi:hypothetical protein